MRWWLSHRFDPVACEIADRHYSRQSVGAPQCAPAGRALVLVADRAAALWITSWQKPEWVKHAWPGAWVCSLFRNEGAGLSSELICEAVAATRYAWPVPAEGMVTFVDPLKVRPKRDPGRCFIRAGFRPVGETKKRRLVVLQLLPTDMPPPRAPRCGEFLALLAA